MNAYIFNDFKNNEIDVWNKILCSIDNIETVKENLNIEKTKIQKKKIRLYRYKTYGFLFGLAMAVWGFGVGFNYLESSELNNIFLIGIVVFFLVGLVYSIYSDIVGIDHEFKLNQYESILEDMLPISRCSLYIDEALRLIKESPACQLHQQLVIDTKREFLMADLKLMRALRKKEIEENKNNLLYQKPKIEINECNFQFESEKMLEKI